MCRGAPYGHDDLDLDDGVPVLSSLDHLAADFEAHLVYDPKYVALRHRSIRPHDEIRAAEGVEVSGVIGHIETRCTAVRAASWP